MTETVSRMYDWGTRWNQDAVHDHVHPIMRFMVIFLLTLAIVAVCSLWFSWLVIRFLFRFLTNSAYVAWRVAR